MQAKGWELGRRTHFDEIIPLYDKIRPDYPEELFNDVFALCNSGAALEIGAGTGKATAPLLIKGFTVTAVEISPNMSGYLRERFNKYKDFRVFTSTFEDAPLEDDAYELVMAASAFHWLDATLACPKVRRILRDKGLFALLRYNFMRDGFDGEEKIHTAKRDYYYGYFNKPCPPPEPRDAAQLLTREQNRRNFGFEAMEDYGFRDVEMRLYNKSLDYTAADYLALLETMSDYRLLPDENKKHISDAVYNTIGDESRGIDYCFQLYTGRK